MKRSGIIVGAGIVGSAVAYELARRGVTNLQVLDVDLDGEWSSSERNVGGVRHLWMNRVNQDLARCSMGLFNELGGQVGFSPSGYLWLYSQAKAGEGETTLNRALKNNLDYTQLSLGELRRQYPFIDKTDDLAFGLFGPRDGVVNPHSLKEYLRADAMAKGVQFHDRVWIDSLEENLEGVHLRATHVALGAGGVLLHEPESPAIGEPQNWKADFVVLCAGAWMAPLLRRLIEKPMVEPVRRQVAFCRADERDISDYGVVVDTSGVYFHAQGGNVTAGYAVKDQKPGFQFDYAADFFSAHIQPALAARSTRMGAAQPVSGFGGLYSYTPDTSGILGWLPGYGKVIEAHSFTGRGVMQCYGAAVAVADLVTEGRFIHLDAQGLTRDRFNSPKATWLHESLHI
jgi:glycine/D-amino acid oxidase-like deaminating enzyme